MLLVLYTGVQHVKTIGKAQTKIEAGAYPAQERLDQPGSANRGRCQL
jgi:hypothetical protein